MSRPMKPRGRDRGRTEAAVVAAAREVLAETGFQGFGVNAVARRAGCDKQLIYRYFGGVEGLIDALGAELAGWLEASVAPFAAEPPRSYAELTRRMIFAFLDVLKASPLMQKIVAWEIADPSPLVARLTRARSLALGGWMVRVRGDIVPPEGLDAPALNAVLIAAVQQLVLSGAAAGAFSGLSLQADADWERVKDAVATLVRGVYGED